MTEAARGRDRLDGGQAWGIGSRKGLGSLESFQWDVWGLLDRSYYYPPFWMRIQMGQKSSATFQGTCGLLGGRRTYAWVWMTLIMLYRLMEVALLTHICFQLLNTELLIKSGAHFHVLRILWDWVRGDAGFTWAPNTLYLMSGPCSSFLVRPGSLLFQHISDRDLVHITGSDSWWWSPWSGTWMSVGWRRVRWFPFLSSGKNPSNPVHVCMCACVSVCVSLYVYACVSECVHTHVWWWRRWKQEVRLHNVLNEQWCIP